MRKVIVFFSRASPFISRATCRHDSISARSMGLRAPAGIAHTSLPDWNSVLASQVLMGMAPHVRAKVVECGDVLGRVMLILGLEDVPRNHTHSRPRLQHMRCLQSIVSVSENPHEGGRNDCLYLQMISRTSWGMFRKVGLSFDFSILDRMME